ncbi:MAG: bacteriocin [Clostridiales bacterium]|nr:bacteriocin [Candidatus Cacconaster stercorequi]
MKTKEELNVLKEEYKVLSDKLKELNEEELTQVVGGDVTSANIVGYAQATMPYIVFGKETDEQMIK